jgi:hypothetical protein
MAIKIFAYSKVSESARALADALDVWLIRHEGSRYRPRRGDTVINWGKGRVWSPARTINHPTHVDLVVNKLHFFASMSARDGRDDLGQLPRVPEWTTDIRVARTWCGVDCQGRAKKVVVRRILNGHEGRGIEIHSMPEDIPHAPLYTKYVPKSAEYRVHMVAGNVIDVQQKVLRRSVDPDTANWGVRNSANGFVFQRQNINVPEDVKLQSTLALRASGLDFAAADVVWHHRRAKAYVLELNTAPGIEGSTITSYATALREYINRI